MKLTNKTHWRSDQLRVLVFEVARRELLEAEFTKRLQVGVKYGRARPAYLQTGYGGYAWYNSRNIVLKLPRTGPIDSVTVAKITAHELAHCQNVHHGPAMQNNRYGWEEGWRETWAWAAAFPVEAQTVVKKPLPSIGDKISKQISGCLRAVEKWQRKTKLAATYLRKYNRRLHYYEARAAAMQKEAA